MAKGKQKKSRAAKSRAKKNAKRKQAGKVGRRGPGPRSQGGAVQRAAPEFFAGCKKLTDAEYAAWFDDKLSDDFHFSFEREGFEGDRCEPGLGWFPLYYEIFGERGGVACKMVVGTGSSGGAYRLYRFVDPDYDMSQHVG